MNWSPWTGWYLGAEPNGNGADEGPLTVNYWIPESRLPELQKKLDKLVRKAERLGVGAVTYEVGAPENRAYVWEKDEARYVPYEEGVHFKEDIVYFRVYPVTVIGTTPRLAGWSFVGTLQHLKDDAGETINLLRIVPGFTEQVPEEYRHRDASNCDHCCRNIPWRKDTFIVRNDATGEFKQVGRQCTQDFLGGKNPQAVAAYLEALLGVRSLGEEYGEESYGGWGRGGEIQYSMDSFLTQTAAVVRIRGWLSRGKARWDEYGPPATADIVLEALGPPPFDDYSRKHWEALREEVKPNEEDAELAEKALEYAREVLSNKPDRDDYEHNLYVATTQPFIGYRLAGITASLIPYYLRHIKQLIEHERAKESDYFGEVGKRADYYFTLLKVIPIESFYGTTYLHRFITRDGDIATWFASRGQGLQPGKEYRVKATVKKHERYKGIRQTLVTRVTVYTEEKRAEVEAKEARKIEREAKRAAKARAKAAKEAAKAAKAQGAALGSGIGLPPEAVEHYIAEEADVFALALYEELGIPPVAVYGYAYGGGDQLERVLVHIAGALPDGSLVDASGVMHPEEMLDEVGWYLSSGLDVDDLRIEPIPVEEVADAFGAPPDYEELAEAREYARLVFEE